MAGGSQRALAGTTLTPPSPPPLRVQHIHTGSGEEPNVLAAGAWEPRHGRNEHPADVLLDPWSPARLSPRRYSQREVGSASLSQVESSCPMPPDMASSGCKPPTVGTAVRHLG